MHHHKANQRLTEYVEGRLPHAGRLETEEHLAECGECAEWVATYRLLADALADTAAASGRSEEHLSSDEVARFAIAAQTLAEPVRASCARHVDSCDQCAEEVTLARAGAAAGRAAQRDDQRDETGEALPASAARSGMFPALRPLAWAAALLLAAGLILVWQGMDGVPGDRVTGEPTQVEPSTVQTGEDILVEMMRVEAGADLTLKAGSTVAFGDGFLVDSGGTLSVVIENQHNS